MAHSKSIQTLLVPLRPFGHVFETSGFHCRGSAHLPHSNLARRMLLAFRQAVRKPLRVKLSFHVVVERRVRFLPEMNKRGLCENRVPQNLMFDCHFPITMNTMNYLGMFKNNQKMLFDIGKLGFIDNVVLKIILTWDVLLLWPFCWQAIRTWRSSFGESKNTTNE